MDSIVSIPPEGEGADPAPPGDGTGEGEDQEAAREGEAGKEDGEDGTAELAERDGVETRETAGEEEEMEVEVSEAQLGGKVFQCRIVMKFM